MCLNLQLEHLSIKQSYFKLPVRQFLPGEDISRAFPEYCIYRCQNWKALFWSNQIDSA